jgi:hypothetical protein
MTTTTTQQTVQTLTTLKAYYEHQLTQADAPARHHHYADLLLHANALLMGLPEQSNGHTIPATPLETTAKATVQTNPKMKKANQAKAKPESVPASRISFQFLPAYQGKTKLEAIGTILKEHQGKMMHQDDIIQELYGELSPEAFKIERLRMRAALIQGMKKKLWQKAPIRSSYILKASTQATTPAQPKTELKPLPTNKVGGRGRAKRKSSTAAKKVLATAKNETALPKKPEIISLQSKTLGAKIILPMHSDFDGLSKIDAVAKVMNETPGIVVNIDDIMERLFGQLSLADYRVEKARMKDVMNRGQGRGLWRQAEEPLSFIVGAVE